MTNKILTHESGRSMVEMLGVLAIIGVLTVVGITGFRQAITKHRANELLNESNKRAAVVAGQLSMMGAAQGSLNEFTQNEFAGGTFKTNPITPINGTFKIGIDNVPDDVCTQMQGMIGGAVIAITPCTTGDDNSILLTYNNDLSAEESDNENGGGYARAPLPEDGPTADDGSTCFGERKGECQVCNQGVYIDSDAICVAQGGGACVDGTCKTPQGCLSNGDCRTIDPTNCGNGDCWCYFANRTTVCGGPTTAGICEPKTYLNRGTTTIDGTTYVTAGDAQLDWWSAKNFCLAHNARMMSIEELGCEGQDYCEDENALFTKIIAKTSVSSTFTYEIQSNCYARYIRASSRHPIQNYTRACSACNVICVMNQ